MNLCPFNPSNVCMLTVQSEMRFEFNFSLHWALKNVTNTNSWSMFDDPDWQTIILKWLEVTAFNALRTIFIIVWQSTKRWILRNLNCISTEILDKTIKLFDTHSSHRMFDKFHNKEMTIRQNVSIIKYTWQVTKGSITLNCLIIW